MTVGRTSRTRGPRAPARCVLAGTLLALALLGGGPLSGQAYTSSEIRGTVVGPTGQAVPSALVSLWSGGRSTGTEVSTGRAGTFLLTGIRPGEYSLRVEALGFHPRVITGITLRPSDRQAYEVALRRGTPPITTVDSLRAPVAGLQAGRWVGSREANAPAISNELRSSLQTVTTMEDGSRPLGLPSGFLTHRIQGVPFRTASVGDRIQDRNAALSQGSAGLVDARLLAPDESFGLGAGGQVDVYNPALAAGESQLSGAYSWSPLWTGRYEIPDDFTPTSLWASGRTSIGLAADSVRVILGGDIQHIERPREGLFPGTTPLSGPGIEDEEMVNMYALLDWELGGGSRIDLGARIGSRPAAVSRFRPAYPQGVSALRARDLVIGGGGRIQVAPDAALGLRAGFTLSERIRDDSENALLTDALPFVTSVGSGLVGGVDPTSAAEGRRSGIFIGLDGQFGFGLHELTAGVEVLRSGHELDPLAGSRLFAGDGDVFGGGWSGLATRFEDAAGGADFSVSRIAVFLRDAWTPTPGVEIRLGARWTREQLPTDELSTGEPFLAATGLELAGPDGAASGLGGYLGLDWTPGESGQLRITGSVGATLDEVSPWLLAEAIALDGTTRLRRTVSTGADLAGWPAFPDGGTSDVVPSFTLLPSDLSLPQTLWAGLGLSTQAADWTFGVSALFRRTQKLDRRADLNQLRLPSGVTDAGREVFGDLVQAGSLVTAAPGSVRRFSDFGPVWYILQDGWSEQASVTLSAEGTLPGEIGLSAWYTWSSTTDNLPGLGIGRPELAGPGTIPDEDWAEGTSDLDVPHRMAGVLTVPVPVLAGAALRSRFRLESGRPFTPGLRSGVDLNGDGIAGNDPVFVPTDGLDDLGEQWDCVAEQRGGFVERNSCRGPWTPFLDVGLSLGLARLGSGVVSLEAEAYNLMQAFDTRIDDALLLVDEAGSLQPDGTALSPGLRLNPGFGGELYDLRPGRMIRIGIRWGAAR